MARSLARIAILAALAAPALLSCATQPVGTVPELTYRHLGPINLAVGSFDVETRYIPPLAPPNVEHRAPVPPYAAVRQWGIDRVQTRGGENTARLVILDASIVEHELPVTGGLKGAFQRQQERRYDARTAVMLEIVDPGRRQLAFVTARAERSQTTPEGMPIAQREKVWFEMTEAMMRDLNAQLEENIQRYFGPYIAAR